MNIWVRFHNRMSFKYIIIQHFSSTILNFGYRSIILPIKIILFQISFEWPLVYQDVTEWQQSPNKSGVFFHEQNICKYTIFFVFKFYLGIFQIIAFLD